MAIKMNAKSKTLLTVLLVGSVCSLRASDLVEPKRLQITGATEQILDAISNVSTSVQSTGMQGAGFDTTTDSLVNISNNTTSVPLATNAQAVDILQGSTAAGTPIEGGTTFTENTNDLTSISLALSAVEGDGFSASTSLYANAQNIALSQVLAAASSSAIITDATAGASGGADFNTDMQTLRDTLNTALQTPSYTNINNLIDDISGTGGALTDIGTTLPTAPFTTASYRAALQALNLASKNWLTFYSQP